MAVTSVAIVIVDERTLEYEGMHCSCVLTAQPGRPRVSLCREIMRFFKSEAQHDSFPEGTWIPVATGKEGTAVWLGQFDTCDAARSALTSTMSVDGKSPFVLFISSYVKDLVAQPDDRFRQLRPKQSHEVELEAEQLLAVGECEALMWHPQFSRRRRSATPIAIWNERCLLAGLLREAAFRSGILPKYGS